MKSSAKRETPSPIAFQSWFCKYCEKDISNVIRIRCHTCENVELCLDCFSVGIEIRDGGSVNHKNNHPYRVIDGASLPLFDEDWSADEELLLLEGIEMFGLGNWYDVKEHVGTKTEEECKNHYQAVYVDSATCPLPDASRLLYGVRGGKLERNTSAPAHLHPDPARGKLKQESKVYFTPNPRFPDLQVDPALGQDLGYIALRDDLDPEYDNDAEKSIATMELSADDPPEEKDLKARMLRVYDFRVQERIRRKEFALERGLLDYKKYQAMEKKRTREEKEVYSRYRSLAKFLPVADFDRFVNGLLEEKRLKRRIEQLKGWRENGIKEIADGNKYEAERANREGDARSRNGKGADAKRTSRKASSDPYPLPLTRSATRHKRSAAPMDITGMPSADLLSQSERDLCSTAHIQPARYMVVKDALMRESYAKGYLRRETASKLVTNLESPKVNKIFDFMVSSGWIFTEPSSSHSPMDTTSAPLVPRIKVEEA